MSEAEVVALCQKAAAAVELTLNPSSPQVARIEAFKLCEDIRNGPTCVFCGLRLARTEFSGVVRHFGLQLLEHSIKYCWNKMSADEKLYLKDNCMALLTSGTKSFVEEETHVKDGVARLIVEIAKREWPQQWEGMLTELGTVCSSGSETQEELILLFFLRLAEDTAILNTFENVTRRKDIQQALSLHMRQILDFFMRCIEKFCFPYKNMAPTERESPTGAAVCRISTLALDAVGAYIEWTAVSNVLYNDGQLLRMICDLLGDVKLRNSAVDCLLEFVTRRGKCDRPSTLFLLKAAPWLAIASATRTALLELTPESPSATYTFAKHIGQVVSMLGQQLGAVYGTNDMPASERPENLPELLTLLLELTRHPSLLIAGHALAAWAQLFNSATKKDPALAEIVPAWLRVGITKILKVGRPSRNDDISCSYSRLDFDADEEFVTALHKVRVETLVTFQNVIVLHSQVVMMFLRECLMHLLTSPATEADVPKWEAFSSVIDSCIGSLNRAIRDKEINEKDIPAARAIGVDMLGSCLSFHTEDAAIYCPFLSFLSALFGFVADAPAHLGPALEKIFTAATFGGTDTVRSKHVMNTRRHALALLVKLATKHSDLLFPVFEQIYASVGRLAAQNAVSLMEKCRLIEAVILLSNKMNNYAKQHQLLSELVAGQCAPVLSGVSMAVTGTIQLISYCGLDQPPNDVAFPLDKFGENRAQLAFCLNLMASVVRRCAWPSDPEVAAKGDFLLSPTMKGVSPGAKVPKNPAFLHLAPMLPFAFRTLGYFNWLWHDDARTRLHPANVKIYEMTESERNSLLGLPVENSSTDAAYTKTCVEKMQSFINNTFEDVCTVLGSSGVAFGLEFYSRLSEVAAGDPAVQEITGGSGLKLVTAVGLSGIHAVPDHWLRVIVRTFLRPFLVHCPIVYVTELCVPILGQLVQFMHWKISESWEKIRSRTVGSNDDVGDMQEVMEEQLVRILSRDYIELIKTLLVEAVPSPFAPQAAGGLQSRKNSIGETDGIDGAGADENGHSSQPARGHSDQRPPELLSERGRLLCQNPELGSRILFSAYSALGWGDATSCLRATLVCKPLMAYLEANLGLIPISNEEAENLIKCVLAGLQAHGEHDTNVASLLSLAAQTYDALRPYYPSLRSIFLQLPGVTEADVEKYDSKVEQPTPLMNGNHNNAPSTPRGATTKMAKIRREMMRKLLKPIIGKNVGQLHKREMVVKSLPSLKRLIGTKRTSLTDSDKTGYGLCSLFEAFEHRQRESRPPSPNGSDIGMANCAS